MTKFCGLLFFLTQGLWECLGRFGGELERVVRFVLLINERGVETRESQRERESVRPVRQ